MKSTITLSPLVLAKSAPAILPERIVLTGFMGAGKSTVGRLLAVHLGWTFVDTDKDVEERSGRTVAEMFAAEGEAAFRRRESAAIARALGRSRVVIALGGGALEHLTNRLLLEQTRHTEVVLLHAAFDILFDRCVMQEGSAVRPVLQDAESALQRYHMRLPLYRRCARLHFETTTLTPRETMLAITASLALQQS